MERAAAVPSRRRTLHQPCARELGRAQLGGLLSPQRQVTCTEGRHWSFAAAGCGHVAEEGRDTASARRVLRRQASFEAAWPQLTATDCLHVSRLYRYRGALRAHRCQRASAALQLHNRKDGRTPLHLASSTNEFLQQESRRSDGTPPAYIIAIGSPSPKPSSARRPSGAATASLPKAGRLAGARTTSAGARRSVSSQSARRGLAPS